MQLARRLFACVLVLALLGETSGVARAYGPGAWVHCCCGIHSSARPCRCDTCPVAKLRTPAVEHDDGRVAGARHCDGSVAGDPGVLRVVATLTELPAPPSLPLSLAATFFAEPTPLRGRAVDVGRPPP